MTDEPNVRIDMVELLFNGWAALKRFTFDRRRRDGVWQTQTHMMFDIGDGATVLPYDPARGVVLLVRQFRLAAHLTGVGDLLIEACAGKLDGEAPETCARREAQEELGYRLGPLEAIGEAFSTPGAVSERVFFFLARYSPADRISDGGGHSDEGEDIEVLELSLVEALDKIVRGEIIDAKTIILLQHLKLTGRLG
jgi:nudix-type nucleoside diphosphatase (YffH/AdpP family)